MSASAADRSKARRGPAFCSGRRIAAAPFTTRSGRREGKPCRRHAISAPTPCITLVAPGRYGIDELAIVGGIRGQPVEMVKCETVDLEVPATAEIVIEGEIPTDYLEKEGPFGEFTGFMAGGRNCPVFNVTASPIATIRSCSASSASSRRARAA